MSEPVSAGTPAQAVELGVSKERSAATMEELVAIVHALRERLEVVEEEKRALVAQAGRSAGLSTPRGVTAAFPRDPERVGTGERGDSDVERVLSLPIASSGAALELGGQADRASGRRSGGEPERGEHVDHRRVVENATPAGVRGVGELRRGSSNPAGDRAQWEARSNDAERASEADRHDQFMARANDVGRASEADLREPFVPETPVGRGVSLAELQARLNVLRAGNERESSYGQAAAAAAGTTGYRPAEGRGTVLYRGPDGLRVVVEHVRHQDKRWVSEVMVCTENVSWRLDFGERAAESGWIQKAPTVAPEKQFRGDNSKEPGADVFECSKMMEEVTRALKGQALSPDGAYHVLAAHLAGPALETFKSASTFYRGLEIVIGAYMGQTQIEKARAYLERVKMRSGESLEAFLARLTRMVEVVQSKDGTAYDSERCKRLAREALPGAWSQSHPATYMMFIGWATDRTKLFGQWRIDCSHILQSAIMESQSRRSDSDGTGSGGRGRGRGWTGAGGQGRGRSAEPGTQSGAGRGGVGRGVSAPAPAGRGKAPAKAGSGQAAAVPKTAGKRVNVNCYNCGQAGHVAADCPSEVELCYNCQQPGHRKDNCPERRVNHVEETAAKAKKAIVEVYVGRNHAIAPSVIAMELDSGSTVHIMFEVTCAKLGLELLPYSGTALSGVNRSQIVVKGETTLEVSFGAEPHRLKFVVVEGDGMPILSYSGTGAAAGLTGWMLDGPHQTLMLGGVRYAQEGDRWVPATVRPAPVIELTSTVRGQAPDDVVLV